MISDSELGRMLFGEKRQSGIHTIEAVAVETSSDGTVKVIPSGIAAGVDASFYVKTQGGVNVGDTVIVSVENGAPINAVSSGSVDIVRTLAEQSQGAYTDDSTYYLLSSTVPATPTDDTWEDAGWSTSEPIIGQEETRTLYVSRRVELVDGTVTWSDPAKVVTSASLDVMRNAIMSTVSETYTTKTEFAESSDTASGSGRTVETEDAAGLELIDLTVYGESVQDGTPSPDAPVEIRTVRGINRIGLTPYRIGGDFYNKAVGFQFVAQASDSAVTLEVSDGNVTMTSTATWRGLVFVSDRLTVGESCVISYEGGEVPDGQIGRTFYTLDSSFKVVRNLGNNTNNPNSYTSASVTIANGEAYIAMGIGVRGSTGTLTFSNLSVISALLTASYVPYGSIGVQALGKNVANHDSKLIFNAYISSAGKLTPSSVDRSLCVAVEPGETYTISGTHVRTSETTDDWNCGAFAVFPIVNDVGTRFFGGVYDESLVRTVTIPDDCHWLVLKIGNSNRVDIDATLATIQIEKGTEATAYEPYRESISYIPLQGNSLASLPDGTKDVLHVEQGRAWIEKNVGYTDMGALTWKYNSNWNGRPAFYTQSLRSNIVDYQRPQYVAPIMCSILDVQPRNVVYEGDDDAICQYGKDVSLRYAGISSAAEFTTAVAGQYLLYKLATPSTIDLGEVSLPTVQDGDTVRIIAEVQPVFDASWWRSTDIVERTTDLETVVKQTAIDVTTAITEASEAASGVEQMQTLIRQYSDGVLVSRTGNEVGALVNADGSFDIVEVSWSGWTPTAGNVLASFGATSANIGAWGDDTQAGDTAELTFFGGSATMRFTVGETRDYLQLESGSLDLLAHDGLAINGHNVNPSGWNLVRQFTGSGAVNFPDLSQTYPYGTNQPYTEVMVAARHSSNYMGSAVIPISLISSTAQETYLSGGATYGGGGRAFCVNLSLTQMTAVAATIDNADYMATTVWYLFAR